VNHSIGATRDSELPNGNTDNQATRANGLDALIRSAAVLLFNRWRSAAQGRELL
jgi:hypothetical protein